MKKVLENQGLFLAEKERFELSRRYNRPTPLAGAPLRPLEYFSVYSTQTAACSRLRPLYYTHFATACQAFFRFSLFLFAIFFSIGSPRLTRGRNRAIIFLSPSPVFSGEKKKSSPRSIPQSPHFFSSCKKHRLRGATPMNGLGRICIAKSFLHIKSKHRTTFVL